SVDRAIGAVSAATGGASLASGTAGAAGSAAGAGVLSGASSRGPARREVDPKTATAIPLSRTNAAIKKTMSRGFIGVVGAAAPSESVLRIARVRGRSGAVPPPNSTPRRSGYRFGSAAHRRRAVERAAQLALEGGRRTHREAAIHGVREHLQSRRREPVAFPARLPEQRRRDLEARAAGHVPPVHGDE